MLEIDLFETMIMSVSPAGAIEPLDRKMHSGQDLLPSEEVLLNYL